MMYRFVTTVIKSSTRNPEPGEVTFSMVLPEVAFISNFSILTNGEENVALVMNAREAKERYNDAMKRGLTTRLYEYEYYTGLTLGERKFNISLNSLT